MKRIAREIREVLWHPHQGLWNWRLVRWLRRVPGGRVLEQAVVMLDSIFLVARVIPQRIGPIAAAHVLYLDCGVHKDGKQIRAVSDWFASRVEALDIIGFEANPYHHRDAVRELADVPHLDLHQVALVGPDESHSTVRLYVGPGSGKGDSLLRPTYQRYLDVPTASLSDFLRKTEAYDCVLLRMNIEGAEQFVIDDLVGQSALGRVSGLYGMWDDLSKSTGTATSRSE